MVPAVTSSQRALTLGFLTPPPHFILQPGGFLLLLIAGLPGGSLFGFSLFLFIYFWLHWVSVAALGLRVPSLAAESGGCSWWWCAGFSLRRLVLLQSSGSGCVGSVVVHGLSCPGACGVFLGQGWNLCPLHWQVDF